MPRPTRQRALRLLTRAAAPLAVATVTLVATAGALQAQLTINITANEQGVGRATNTAGFNKPLMSMMTRDPGPGGLASALTYDLAGPPALTSGDVLVYDAVGGPLSDVIRFNTSSFVGGGTGSLVFYSLAGEGALADVGFPTAFYANTFSTLEINGAVTYTPVAGQPGFVAGASGPVTYVLESAVVPEPATWALLGTGLLAVGGVVRRRTRA